MFDLCSMFDPAMSPGDLCHRLRPATVLKFIPVITGVADVRTVFDCAWIKIHTAAFTGSCTDIMDTGEKINV